MSDIQTHIDIAVAALSLDSPADVLERRMVQQRDLATKHGHNWNTVLTSALDMVHRQRNQKSEAYIRMLHEEWVANGRHFASPDTSLWFRMECMGEQDGSEADAFDRLLGRKAVAA